MFALIHNKKSAVLEVIPRRRFFAIRTFLFRYSSCCNDCRKEQEGRLYGWRALSQMNAPG